MENHDLGATDSTTEGGQAGTVELEDNKTCSKERGLWQKSDGEEREPQPH